MYNLLKLAQNLLSVSARNKLPEQTYCSLPGGVSSFLPGLAFFLYKEKNIKTRTTTSEYSRKKAQKILDVQKNNLINNLRMAYVVQSTDQRTNKLFGWCYNPQSSG